MAAAGALTLTAAGALAQAEAERRLDAAIERLRTAIGPSTRITMAGRQIDPVSGRARLSGVETLDGPRRATIAEITLLDISDTRLGRAELRQLRMVEGVKQTIDVGRMVLGGLMLPAPGAPFDPALLAAELVEVEGVAANSAAEGQLSIGRLVLDGYAPGRLEAGRVEGVAFRGNDAAEFRLGRLVVRGLTMPLLSANADPRAFMIEQFTLEGAALRDPDAQVEVSVGRASLRDWIPGRLMEASLEGAMVGAEFGPLGPGVVRLGRMEATGIDGAATLAAILNQFQPPDPRPGTPQRMTLEGLTVEGGGQPLGGIGRIVADAAMDAAGISTAGMAWEGVTIMLPPGLSEWLVETGYRTLRGAIDLRVAARRETGLLEVDPFRIAVAEAGTLTIGAQALGYPLPAPGTPIDADNAGAQLGNARLTGMTLRWEDGGLFARALTRQALALRMPEARLREQWAQMALTMPLPGEEPARPQPRGRAPAPAPVAKDGADALLPMRQAIAAFIRNPGTIEIALRPSVPIVFNTMQARANAGPAEAVRVFGLSVTNR